MTYQKQAMKTINQFVEDAGGNWHNAKVDLDNWCVEVVALNKIECVEAWNHFVYELDLAWAAMAPAELAIE
jgi:hypothetical protein